MLIHNVLPIPFADDTTVIVTDSNIVDFQFNVKVVFEQLKNWFNINLLNVKKIFFIHFKTKNAREIDCKLQFENKFIANFYDTKCKGLCLSNTMDWIGECI